ncbi:MAG: acyl carrier protein [bacterium]
MEIKEFVVNFAEQFDGADIETFNASTKFREQEEWSSLVALSIIAMIDEEYDISIPGEKLRELDTIEDVFNFIRGL